MSPLLPRPLLSPNKIHPTNRKNDLKPAVVIIPYLHLYIPFPYLPGYFLLFWTSPSALEPSNESGFWETTEWIFLFGPLNEWMEWRCRFPDKTLQGTLFIFRRKRWVLPDPSWLELTPYFKREKKERKIRFWLHSCRKSNARNDPPARLPSEFEILLNIWMHTTRRSIVLWVIVLVPARVAFFPTSGFEKAGKWCYAMNSGGREDAIIFMYLCVIVHPSLDVEQMICSI